MKKFYNVPALLLLLLLPMVPAAAKVTAKQLSAAAAQQASLRGVVVDETGATLPGASVKNLNNGGGTATNEQGVFTISAAPADKLLISMVGYESQTVTVGNARQLRISLKVNAQALKELVYVGYGTQKKGNLTGAAATVDTKMLEDRPVGTMMQALQGVAPGVNINMKDGRPGSTGAINIRGVTSINGGEPLVLIDGIPGELADVNADDVANISILKDASSAAIYGARAAFGVVLVTTKQGKSGKVQVSYTNNFAWLRPTVRTDFMTSGYDVAAMVDEAFIRSTGSTYTHYTQDDMAELLKRKEDPTLPSVVVQNRAGKDQYVYYGNTDWWHEIYRDEMSSMNHTLNISGGADKINYFLSGRVFQQNGIMRLNRDTWRNYFFRGKLETQVNKWLKVSDNIQFNSSTYNFPGKSNRTNFISPTVHALPSYVPANPDGTSSLRTMLNNYDIGDGIFAELRYGKSKGVDDRFNLSNLVTVDVTPAAGLGLHASYNFTFNPSHNLNRSVKTPWSVFPGVMERYGNDMLSESTYNRTYHVFNAYADYARDFQKHHLKALVGYNQELYNYHRIQQSKSDLISEDLNEMNLGTTNPVNSSSSYQWALMGMFGRINYDYNNKYLIELNGRYDGSSRFPSDQNFGFFPSVSAGWRISKERLFKPLLVYVDNLKVRASYGSLGNQGQADVYGYVPQLGIGTLSYIFDGVKGTYVNAPAPTPDNLTWEKVRSADVGVDITAVNRRLEGTFDWYERKTIGMLIPGATQPAVYGATVPKANAGDLRTRGWEASLAWKDNGTIAGKRFDYNVSFGVADFRAFITKFDNPQGLLNNYYTGSEFGAYWGYTIDGYFTSDEEAKNWKINQDYVDKTRLGSNGEWQALHAGDLKFADLNGDGKINVGKNTVTDHGDLTIIGNQMPRYSFNSNLGFRWNGIDVSAFIQGIGKQNWYPGSDADKFWGPYARPYTSFMPKDIQQNIWSAENPDAYFPLLRGYLAQSSGSSLNVVNNRYMQNLAYIRLKNLTLGYTLQPAVLKTLHVTKVRIYLSGENLFTATKLKTKYIDPEQAAADANNQRLDNNARNYPFSKMVSLGLNMTF